jgi:hypothetical protein
MLPIDFPERNFIYTKPQGWTDEQCIDLPVWKGQVPIDDKGNTDHTIISCWQPSKEDIEAINAGKPIYMYVTAMAQPPVSLSTEYPFIQQEVKS